MFFTTKWKTVSISINLWVGYFEKRFVISGAYILKKIRLNMNKQVHFSLNRIDIDAQHITKQYSELYELLSMNSNNIASLVD